MKGTEKKIEVELEQAKCKEIAYLRKYLKKGQVVHTYNKDVAAYFRELGYEIEIINKLDGLMCVKPEK